MGAWVATKQPADPRELALQLEQYRQDVLTEKVGKLLIYCTGEKPQLSSCEQIIKLAEQEGVKLAFILPNDSFTASSDTVNSEKYSTKMTVGVHPERDVQKAVVALGCHSPKAVVKQFCDFLRTLSIYPFVRVPPSPPVVGHLHKLTIGAYGCLYDAMLKLRQEYGDAYRIKAGSRYWYIFSDMEIMKEIMLTRADEFPKGETLTELRAIGIGESGLTEVEGDEWLRQRRLCLPVFRPKHLRTISGQDPANHRSI
jgi:hypothetical protein